MNSPASLRLFRSITGALTAIMFLANMTLPAQARIEFQDDIFNNFDSDGLRIGANDAGVSNTSIRFGADVTASENGNITWNISTNKFGIDHTVDITGGLSANGQVNFSSATGNRLRESSNPTTSAACTTVKEVIVNTTTNGIEICTVTGGAGAATWVAMSAGNALTLNNLTSSQFMRTDASNTVTTGTTNFNAGTTLSSSGTVNFSNATSLNTPQGAADPGTCSVGQLFYNTTLDALKLCTSSNTWTTVADSGGAETLDGLDSTQFLRSDTSDNYTSGTLTFDGGTTLDVQGNATVGDGGDSISVNSSTWSISAPGVASGLTGVTSTGSVDFTAASSFKTPQGAADPGTCSVGEQFYNTTGNQLKVCTSTNVWTALSTGSQDFEQVYATDVGKNLTTSNGPFTIDTGTNTFTVTGSTNVNASNGTAATNIATGTTTGAVTIGGTGTQTIDVGDGAGVKTVGLGSSNTTSTTNILSGSGGLNQNVSNNQPTNINTGTSTGTVTIGGTGTQTIAVGNGAGVKTVGVGSTNTTSTTNINSGSGAVNVNASNNQPTNIGTGTSTGTVTLGGTGTQTIAVGNGAGVKTTQLGSNNTTSTTTILSGTGGLSLNATAGTATTNIGTGSTTGQVSVGGGSDCVAVDSNTWDISCAGVGSGFTGFSSSGTVTTSGTLSGTGTIDFSTGTSFKTPQAASDPVTCAVGQEFYNTTSNVMKICTATNTWTQLSLGAGDFEGVYSNDADKILTTSNAAFTIATGTNDFIVDSNDWNVTAAGALDAATVTSNGLLTGSAGATISGATTSINASSNFATNIGTGSSTGTVTLGGTGTQTIAVGNGAGVKTTQIGSNNTTSTTTLLSGTGGLSLNATAGTATTNIGTGSTTGQVSIGGNADCVAVDSNTWDISCAGVGSGFTGLSTSGTLTSSGTLSGTGTVNFSTATSFLSPQAASDPATCSVGQQFYNTTSNKMKICTATNTWSILANGTIDFEAVYAADGDATLTTTNGNFNVAAGTGAVAVTATTGGISLNASTNGAVNVATGTSTGTVTLGGTGTQTIAVGNGAGVKTVNLGSSNTTSTTTILSGSGGVLVNDANNQPTSIGTGTSTGTVTLGGTGTQTIAVGNGAGVKTVNVGSSNTTSTTTILSGSGAVNVNANNNQPTNIGTGTTTGTVTIGGTGTQTIDVGDGAGVKTVGIGSSNTTSTTNILSGSGAVNVNASNNQNTNINTGTSTGTINLGNASSTTTELGIVNASGAANQRIRESATPNTSAACTTLNEIIMDTTEHITKTCTTVGAAGVAVWTTGGSTGGNYSAASDATTQTLTTLGTFKDITFGTNDQLSGWTHTAATANFTAGATGIYLVSARIGGYNAGTDTTGTIQLRARNSTTATEIAGSNVTQATRDPASHYSNITSTFVMSVTAGDVITFQFNGNRAGAGVAGDFSIRTQPASPASVGSIKSANVTIIRLK